MTASPTRLTGARETLSLDGEWSFRFTGPTAKLEGERTIHVPGIWQTQFEGLRNAHGVGVYRKPVALPAGFAGKRVVLVMEGVMHVAHVFVDSALVATSTNGWTDIEVDITDALKGASSFELRVDATVPDDRHKSEGGFSFALAGKQDWYGIHGGIWKPCRLEARDPVHLARVDVRATLEGQDGVVRVRGQLAKTGGSRVEATLWRAGAKVVSAQAPVNGAEFAVALRTPDVAPWSPDVPNLYEVTVELIDGERKLDHVARTIGFRRFEAKNGALWLNGAPFYIRGALDQDWYPEHDCRPLDRDQLETRFRNAKALGLNALRLHVKIPDRLYHELADRLGLMVWQDMPYGEFLAPETRVEFKKIFERSVAAHGHHPSICIWTLFNEGWGIDQDDNPDDRRFLKETFDWAKTLAPDCLIVDNSPCFPRNYHVKTDIDDFHWYSGFPLHNDVFEKLTNEFAKRPAWSWSPHGDAVKTGHEPLVCSEFGVWGLPHPKDIGDKHGNEPWWFESGHDWNQGAAYAHGIETRFRDAQLEPIFGDLDGFVDAAQEFQYRALKYQIETLRWARPISGYIITELNDVQWESNGLMDVENNPRRFADRLFNLQQDHLIIARAKHTALSRGQRVEAQVALAGAGETPEGAWAEWRFAGQSGRVALGAAPATISFEAPATHRFALQDLELTAFDVSGKLLSRNVLEFCLAPSLAPGQPKLFAIEEGAGKVLAGLTWPAQAQSADSADVVLATRLTTPVRELVLAGKKVLLIANKDDALVDPARKLPLSDRHNFPTAELKARDGTPWDGRWMGAFGWRRTDGPWNHLPPGAMFDEHWIGLVPNHVLTGFLAPAWGGLVNSGMVVGWLHKAAGFAKRSFLGKGWINIATFDLTSPEALANPIAPHLLAALAKF